ncbi:MAG TPA: 2,3,4,5-tetrahydropyridine-2,6-dicarboxylate N-succinyltransferase [Bdellovibrionota bacterium]|jgi:2,3,4,5-tetrahydropyridine-2-carboxylate N-succinyltransferase|nr:2,3,4,5-tetrahydropyridine-2,6-dicarboxylate N-succinyltransferase [Bdellovibrionota bacterium]
MSQTYSEILDALEAGTLRAATPVDGKWHVNLEVKAAILEAFKAGKNAPCPAPHAGYIDKSTLMPQVFPVERNIRVVPAGSAVRRGAYLAPGVIMMPPSYVNVGAYVDEGTMVDSHALVGSCAQIGKRVHLSAAVQIGGVLEPIGQAPVIIEDDAFIGAGSVIVEGILVRKFAVLAPGVKLSKGVTVYDLTRERQVDLVSEGIPEGAVVVPGSRPVSSSWGKSQGLSAYCALIVKYRDDKTSASTVLEAAIR